MKKTEEYLKEHAQREWKKFEADEDAEYDQVIEIDLSTLRPTVSFPHLPDNTRTIDNVGEVKDRPSCYRFMYKWKNIRFKSCKRYIKGQKVYKEIRCIVIQGTQKIYLEALEGG